MFPRILDRVVEWVKAHKQFGLEFEERSSRTWVFVRTWRRDSFYRVAVGVIDRYLAWTDRMANWSSLGKFCVRLAGGDFDVNFWGVTNSCRKLQRVSGKRVHARSVGLSNFWRQFAQTLPTKNCFHCVRDARSLFDDWIHRDPTQRRWASWLDAVETIFAKGDWDRWIFSTWAGGCF